MSLAERLGLKVHVDQARLKALMCFDWSVEDHAKLTAAPVNPATVKGLPAGSLPVKAAILVVGMGQLTFDAIQKVEAQIYAKSKCKFNKIVAYQPTGWTHTTGQKSPTKALMSSSAQSFLKIREKDRVTIYSCPYSEHSSFSELVEFMHAFKPQRIIPTVNTSVESSKKQVDILKQYSNDVYNDDISGLNDQRTVNGVTSSFAVAIPLVSVSSADIDRVLHRRRFESEFS
jgi:hypothetical protein